MISTSSAKTIAIIGAGPSGLVAAKYFLAEKAFEKIVIFEQRHFTGGIWNYTPDERDEDIFTIPQTNPKGKISDPKWKPLHAISKVSNGLDGINGSEKYAEFLSPIYDKLETNIPRGLMGFSDLNWPQDSQLFPKHETVLEYIQEYGKDVEHLIRFETQVVDVEPKDDGGELDRWIVRSRDLKSGAELNELYGAVVVANGHFTVPSLPPIPGAQEWNKRYPGTITHSKYYRTPDDFNDKKVVVIGNSASGLDISNQVAAVCKLPLVWSVRSASQFGSTSDDPRRREFPPIANFLPDQRAIKFQDGRIEYDIESIIFATGYFYSLPFLEKIQPPLIENGSHVQHTYQHLFYAPRPTLSFLVLNQRVIPFPIAEAQSAVLARIYSGRLSLPTLSEMEKWEKENIEERGGGKKFHLLPFPQDANYLNALSHWSLSAPPKDGLENDGKGKVPPVWRELEYWTREKFPAIRKAFGEKGGERHTIRSLQELGYDFDEYVSEKAASEGKLL